MKSKGLNPTSEIINFKVKKADELAELFAINPVNDLYYLERLRMIDNIPFLLEQTYLPAELLPDFKETDLTGNSLFKLLEDKYQIQLFQAEAAVEPILIEGKLAEKMQIKTSVLGLAIQQKTFSQSDRLIEFTQAYYRSDQYKFKLKFNKKNLKEEK